MQKQLIDFRVGNNDPSPVTRVLILGYYDGATDGVLQLGDGGRVYRFDLDQDAESNLEQRTFVLRPLPNESWEQLVGIIAEHIPPQWPYWVPLWRFPTPQIQHDVECRTDAILDQAGDDAWLITTSDPVAFQSFTARPAVRKRSLAV